MADFDREQLITALDEVGRAALAAKARLDIAIYDGSALMLASNFRFGTEDVDIAELGEQWPDWLKEAVDIIAVRNGWSKEWLNHSVTFHLSSLAVHSRDLTAFGTFPLRSDKTGITVFVPTARYMLALKLKALRVSDFAKGSKDIDDVRNLLVVLNITEIEPAIEILAEFFPRSGADADKQRFVLKNILSRDLWRMRPATLAEATMRIVNGTPQEKALPEFLDTFYLALTDAQRLATISERPVDTGDHHLDAFLGAAAEYLARQYRLAPIPDWVFEPQRYLDHAWHVSQLDSPGMREYLTFASPAEFRSRNIFTEERPLRRARANIA